MKTITFTQYLLPNGKRTQVETTVPEHVYDKAQDIFSAGFWLEVEILRNGKVYASITDEDMDWANIVSVIGPPLTQAIINMIMDFKIPEDR